MSAQPVTALATITTPVDDKTNLRGKQPPAFDGTRSTVAQKTVPMFGYFVKIDVV